MFQDLERFASSGWFKVGDTAGFNGDEPGVMLIVPSRLGLLIDLQDEGWNDAELQSVARYEDEMIEWVYTTDELTYEDSPEATLARFFEEEALLLEHEAQRALDGSFNNLAVLLRGRGISDLDDPHSAMEIAAQWRTRAERYRNMDFAALAEESRLAQLRLAYRVAFRNDIIRVMLLDADRRRVTAGYSPFVVVGRQSYGPGDQFDVGDILWGVDRPKPLASGRRKPVHPIAGTGIARY